MRMLLCCLLLIVTHATAGEYQLGAGDEIQIMVYGEADLTRHIKIDKTGLISFPFLSDIAVLGLTPKALANTIAAGLRGDYLIAPQVSVTIVKYRPFFIHGQVQRPGGYSYQEDLTLDKAIAIAGGLAARASKSAWYITRLVAGEKKVIKAKVTSVILPDDIIEIEQSYF
ncbi:polysaccharide export outer membrane protein [Colwellia chukchiensis]|uniref:Polysaccharide export outer membrane protein n=1 Tax=Colwellia chukchiensis TaxID=641665 RepID=A0A1H7PRF6_9GAMM|nr:polysaccharide biosynthesis/export family protein [Colwellia chukchiensis]SEL38166.1 polysaccharide export outer membrane protein [Colwellia chukchiensis]